MRTIVVDGLLGDGRSDAGCQGFASPQVAAPAGMRTAGNLQAQPMSPPETMGCGPHINCYPQALVWARLEDCRRAAIRPRFLAPGFNPEETIADVDRASIGGNIAQPAEEIGVG